MSRASRWITALWSGLFAFGVLIVAMGFDLPRHDSASHAGEAADQAQLVCAEANPPYVAATYHADRTGDPGAHRSIVLAADSHDSLPSSHRVLANYDQTGSIYGLAVDDTRQQVYAGASGDDPFFVGPSGLGAIYRIDIPSGAIETWHSMEAGDPPRSDRDWSPGDLGLGDLELSEARDELYAVSLHDHRIHRFSVPDGRSLGSFAHGAAGEAWAANARVLGLGVRYGQVWHGVVDSREDPDLPGALRAFVYRSLPDGSRMERVVEFTLDYRSEEPWVQWESGESRALQPWLSDIEFRPNGDPIIGLRARGIEWGGHGDVLPTVRESENRWRAVIGPPEHYKDDTVRQPESAYGGLAAWPRGDGIVASIFDPISGPGSSLFCCGTAGLVWWDNARGRVERINPDGLEALTLEEPSGIGDIEPLCLPDYPTATPSATPTETATPTSTPRPSHTPIPTATETTVPSPTPLRWEIFLPLAQRSTCFEAAIDVALVIDLSTSMLERDASGQVKLEAALEAAGHFLDLLELEDRVALVGFNDTAWVALPLTGDRGALDDAWIALPSRVREGTRLDSALAAGRLALEEADPARVRSLVLLTDGRPNRVPLAEDGRMETTVLREAEAARAAGLRVFTIGLGAPDDVYEELLEQVADGPERYHHAPDASVLGAVYRALASQVRCTLLSHVEEPELFEPEVVDTILDWLYSGLGVHDGVWLDRDNGRIFVAGEDGLRAQALRRLDESPEQSTGTPPPPSATPHGVSTANPLLLPLALVDAEREVLRGGGETPTAVPSALPLPDLFVSRLTWCTHPEQGLVIHACVGNSGSANAGPFSNRLAGGSPAGWDRLPGLAPRATACMPFAKPGAGGLGMFVVDADDEVEESDETNNSKPFGVPTSQPPCPTEEAPE